MPVPPELLRLQGDITRFRRIESQGLAQRVDRVGEPSEAEQEVASLEPRPSVRPVLVEDPPVRLQGFFLTIEQHQDIRSIEPSPGVLRSISKESVVTVEGRVVVFLLEERLGLLS